MALILHQKDPKDELLLNEPQPQRLLTQDHFQSNNELLKTKRNRSWINHRGSTFHVEYVRSLLTKVAFLLATKDLTTALKDTLICVACSDSVAVVRAKALKAIGYAVRRNQNLMLDLQV